MATALRQERSQNPRTPGNRLEDWHASSVDFLARLRLLALRCRASARADLHEACTALYAGRDATAEAHAEALVRTLPQVLSHIPRFHRPGVEEVSFDEAWLLRLFEAASAPDPDSFEFLMRSRVPPMARRSLGFLVSRAARFDAVA